MTPGKTKAVNSYLGNYAGMESPVRTEDRSVGSLQHQLCPEHFSLAILIPSKSQLLYPNLKEMYTLLKDTETSQH
jgi:hypothetical protein